MADGIKTQRLVGQAHAAIEPGKSIPIWKFHQMTGHIGEYLMKTTADYMGIKLTGNLIHVKHAPKQRSGKPTSPRRRNHRFPADQDTGCSLT